LEIGPRASTEAGLPHPRAQAGVAAQLRRRRKRAMSRPPGVDAVLRRRAMTDQMQTETGQLTLAAKCSGAAARSPGPGRAPTASPTCARRSCRSCTPAAPGRVDLRGVGVQDVPAMLLEAVVDEPGAVHRLDHPAHPLAPHTGAGREPAQPIGIGGEAHPSTISPSLDSRPTSTFLRLRSIPARNIGEIRFEPRWLL
jgi:hypothetical protein